jgi:triacylglycerol lipase
MVKLSLPSGSQFNYSKAIELANLIERSYENYKNFKDPHDTNQLLAPGVITTGSEKIKDLCKDPDSATVEPIKGDIEYQILGVFREFVGEDNDTPMGFIAQRKNGESLTDDYYVIFRGTMEKDEWKENFRSEQDVFSIPNQGFNNLGKVATGFMEIYTRNDPESNSSFLSIANLIGKIFNQSQLPTTAKIFVSGHSLGGALATMATRHLLAMNLKPILYTYASPRVGDKDFTESLAKTQCYRVANSEDIVPYVALATLNPTGDDMPSNNSNNFVKGRIEGLSKFTRLFDFDVINLEDEYTHVGEPIYFTDNRGAISMNHNMYRTYREALANP